MEDKTIKAELHTWENPFGIFYRNRKKILKLMKSLGFHRKKTWIQEQFGAQLLLLDPLLVVHHHSYVILKRDLLNMHLKRSKGTETVAVSCAGVSRLCHNTVWAFYHDHMPEEEVKQRQEAGKKSLPLGSYLNTPHLNTVCCLNSCGHIHTMLTPQTLREFKI